LILKYFLKPERNILRFLKFSNTHKTLVITGFIVPTRVTRRFSWFPPPKKKEAAGKKGQVYVPLTNSFVENQRTVVDLPSLFHACLCIALHAALATWSTLSAIAVFRCAKCMCEKESLTSTPLSLSLWASVQFFTSKKKKLTQGCKVQAILITSVYS
jgi:hypothetical protein